MNAEILVKKAQQQEDENLFYNFDDIWSEFLDFISYNGASFETHNLREIATSWQDIAQANGVHIGFDDALDDVIAQLQHDLVQAYSEIEMWENRSCTKNTY